MYIRKKLPKRHSSFETRVYAIRQVVEKQRSNREVADELGVHIHSVRHWVNNFKKNGEAGLESKKPHLLPDDRIELERLRIIEKKYSQQQEEIEILKKFQAFLMENATKKHTKP